MGKEKKHKEKPKKKPVILGRLMKSKFKPKQARKKVSEMTEQ